LPIALAHALCLTILSGPAFATPLLGVTFLNQQLISINETTGVGTLNGVFPGGSPSDLATFGGNLYIYDQTANAFDTINPVTAAIIASTPSGANIGGEGGFTFRADGTAFLTNSAGATGQLYSCNAFVTNGCVLVGGLGPSMDGIAFSLGGTLYGLSQSPTGTAQPSLYTIDTTTGATTLIGSTGLTGVNVGGLAVDPNTGVLYAGINGSLYTINTTTGAATLVGNTGFSLTSGIAFEGSASISAVPEPATLLLVGSGLASVGARRWRNRRQGK
jgi:hypothetical protein